MQRTIRIFKTVDISEFKSNLLNWSQQFETLIWLDSNNHNQQYNSFDCALAADEFTSIKTDYYNAFEKLKEYQTLTKDYIFGYLTYDVKNDVEQLSSSNFDGLHLGHKAILNQLVNTAKKDNLSSILLTFFPHPRMILQKDSSLKLINTINERSAIIKQTGVSNLIIHPFTKEFSRLTALEFVRDILVNQLHIKKIIIGYDHQFGRNRTATINDLIEFGNIYDFEVIEITAQQLQNVSISSTKIRKALEEGDVKTANQYLGYPFMLSGKIVKGKGIGKTLAFPTANLKIKEDYKLIPKNGVYLVKSSIDSQLAYGMMNIGTNPTVSDSDQLSVEVFFFDFDKTLYGQSLTIEVLDRIRDEQKFSGLVALKVQLEQDRLEALAKIEGLKEN